MPQQLAEHTVLADIGEPFRHHEVVALGLGLMSAGFAWVAAVSEAKPPADR